MERIKSSEEYKAVKLLEKMTKNYSLNSEELHYAIILYNLITNLQNNNQKLKKQIEVIDRLNFIKNRKNQGASQENINKMAIEFVNSWLKEVSE